MTATADLEPERPRVAAVIQARMGSSRLPGKVLMPIAGRPLLWHIIHRLRKSRRVTHIALATSTHPREEKLVAFARAEGISVVRGSEDDVLGRFALAAERLKPDFLVRIVGDAPLIDPDIIDHLVDEMIANEADFITSRPGQATIHDGVDPFSIKGLNTLLEAGRDDPVAVEHVTAWFKANPEAVRIHYTDVDPRYRFEGARVSVDTPDDIAFLNELHARLGAAPGEVSLAEVVSLLGRDPALMALNAHVRQKRTTDVSATVLMRADGGREIGLGHLTRCLAIAHSLRNAHGLGVRFLMQADPVGEALVAREGFPHDTVPPEGEETAALLEGVEAADAAAVLFDLRTDLPRASVEAVKALGAYTVVLDDASDRRLGADVAIYPPVPAARRLKWPDFNGGVLIGWDMVPLAPGLSQAARTPPPVRAGAARKRVLVTLGGADPKGWTGGIVDALARASRKGPGFDITAVIGPAMREADSVAEALGYLEPACEIVRAPSSLVPLAREADLAVITFGVTAYEFAALGLPSVILGLTGDHAGSAEAFVDAGIGISLGIYSEERSEEVALSVAELLAQPDRLETMAGQARRLIDGRGAARIAELIASRVAERAKARSGRAVA